jgi:hypothetical protein
VLGGVDILVSLIHLFWLKPHELAFVQPNQAKVTGMGIDDAGKFSGASMLGLRQVLSDQGVLLSYSGPLNEAILYAIGQCLQIHLLEVKVDAKISRAMFSAFVEEAQNIIRYSIEVESQPKAEQTDLDQDGSPMKLGMITIGIKPNGRRFVACGNLIRNADVARIRNSLEAIRGLRRKELSSLMREMLKQSLPEGHKGAGVGLISIARESDGNWDYDMVPDVDGQHTFFCFEALI